MEKTEMMEQKDFERLSSLMTYKGVVHEAFELLADLRQSEKMMKEKVDAIKYSIIDCLQPFTDFEGFSVSEVNYLQVIRKMKDQLRWRPVSEKPERCGEYLCTWDFSDSVVMYYDDSGWSVWDASWDDYIDTANPPKYWLPIPPAPEGEKAT